MAQTSSNQLPNKSQSVKSVPDVAEETSGVFTSSSDTIRSPAINTDPSVTSMPSAPYGTRSTHGIFKKRLFKDAAQSSDDEFPTRISPKKSKTVSRNLSVQPAGDDDFEIVSGDTNVPNSRSGDIPISLSPLKLALMQSEPSKSPTTGPTLLMQPITLKSGRNKSSVAGKTADRSRFDHVQQGAIDRTRPMLHPFDADASRRSTTLDDPFSPSDITFIDNDVTPKAKVRIGPAISTTPVTPFSFEDELEPHEIQRIMRIYIQQKRKGLLNTVNAGATPYEYPDAIDLEATPTPVSSRHIKRRAVSSARINDQQDGSDHRKALAHSDLLDDDGIRLHPDEEDQIQRAIKETRADLAARNMSILASDTVIASSSTGSSSNAVATTRKTFGDVLKPPTTSRIMSNGPVLYEDTMKFVVTSLPLVCEVSDPSIQDVFLKDDYPSLPHLCSGTLVNWNATANVSAPMTLISFSEWAGQCPKIDFEVACAAIRFVRYKHFVNPSRVSPRNVNILYTTHDQKKSVLQCNYKTAICLSTVFVYASQLLEPASTGLRNKYLSGYMHTQEWERMEGFACMVFNRPTMIVQINQQSLTFGTMGPIKDREPSSPSKGPQNPKIFASSVPHKSQSSSSRANKIVLDCTDAIPVYDARAYPEFNFESDLEDIASVLPLYPDELPYGSFVVVAYTMGHYEKSSGFPNLTTNIIFAILFATE